MVRASSSVGVIGLGAMGAPIARSLSEAGLRVLACDVQVGRAKEAVPTAALHTTVPHEAASGADAVLIIVADDAQARQALFGDQGVLTGMVQGSSIVLHSTLSPEFCRKVETGAAVNNIGVVDAPLSGGVAGAMEGRLTAMVGGDEATLGQVKPILTTYCRQIHHLGAVGAGQVTKLANNLLATAYLALVREALLLTTAAGISAETARGVFSTSTGQSWAVDGWPTILENFRQSPGGLEYVVRSILTKDMVLIERLAESLGVQAPLAHAVLETIGELDDKGIQ